VSGTALPSSQRALFVYYRVDAADLEAVLSAVRQLHDTLVAGLAEDAPGLQAAVWRRPELRDGEVTIMETYQHPHGIDTSLERRIERAAQVLSPWLRGARHTEVFERL
jgi:hypothetical protein